jgi:hypothetical protein
MYKLLFVIYYSLSGIIDQVHKGLINNDIMVDTFPLFMYSRDANNRRDDYSYMLNKTIKENCYDGVLFWCLDIENTELEIIKKCNNDTIFMFYNCYDPHSWNIPECDIINKSKNFDVIFTCCKDSIKKYDNAIFLPPGWRKGEFNAQYKCDVSMCVHSLHSNRKALIEKLNNLDIDFNLYGNESLKEYSSYKGEVSYDEVSDIYSSSKISITTHIIDYASCYVNDSEIRICGNQSLLLRDNNRDSFFDTNESVIIEDDIETQVKDILNNYDCYKDIIENAHEKALNYTWDSFGREIKKNLKKTTKILIKDDIEPQIRISLSIQTKLSIFRKITRTKQQDTVEIFNEINKKYPLFNASDILEQYFELLDY